MVSPCPSCKAEVNHEDYQFEVECACGMRFNPFYDANLVGQADSELTPTAPDPSQFAEASSAFREIVEFGETGETKAPPKVATPPTMPSKSKSSAPKTAPIPSASPELLMTAGPSLSGYALEAFLGPISTSVPLELDGPDPLRPAFQSLWQTCQGKGANAVIDLEWCLTPDGNRCLMSGTAVRCSRSS